jgi:hypothetical protein
LPLALGRGDGAELRWPLGLSVLGGLLLSQLLTLYTTPVVFVGLERLRQRLLGPRIWPRRAQPAAALLGEWRTASGRQHARPDL